ncbi:hypothetical protein NP233_g10774 [Leucocoprinus birnbaumii]|uniref:Uncharacterized protein n=1 Tax=Leucocoprinus birnbaumii TaxID=56174 RepID=A0AAD5VJR1_9AGAR|nr:hypothetical protein NP233_g10774 [Leucocoprinus birnbaumii]
MSTPSSVLSSPASPASPTPPANPDTRSGSQTGNGAVGLANPQMSRSRRRMLDLINALISTGVQVDIDLPQIAVVGNQSAGKSSLIESISGITLPRASGTCTRCPTECRLTYAATPWKCTVSLSITTDASGQPLGQARTEAFGPPIFDKAEVEDRIRRAQLAILNPGKPAQSFLTGNEPTLDEGSTLTFSKNCVSLAISGPDVADLTFVDLPGLIASVGRGGNPNDIQLVENLVTTYIKRHNCIILLTVACETDFENQGAHHLAKKFDPEGKRTIGVLTKPDRIAAGDEQDWLKFIRNERESLQNNWFCVKQPASNELKQNWTWEQARRREDDFFSGTSPWNELEPMYARYLRTRNLVERCSQVLSDLIAKRLPEIQREIEVMISKTRKEIGDLPKPPPRNALNEVARLIKDFDADVRHHIEGVPYKEGIIQQIRGPSKKFRRAIRATAPEFKPFDASIFEACEVEYISEGSRPRRRAPAAPDFLKHEEEETTVEEESEISDDEYDSSEHCIYINEVHRRMEESVSRELPGHFPYIVEREYIGGIQKKWENPAVALCERVHRILMSHTQDLVQKHFAAFGQGMLEHRISLIIHEHLRSCLEEAKKKMTWLMKIQADPFTLNGHYFADCKEKFLVHYRRERQNALARNGRTISNDINLTREALSYLTRLGYEVNKEDLAKLLKQDMMEPALGLMASVRAYFQVAYKRFVDNVPMAIDYELIRGGEVDVFQLLWTKLELDGPDAHQMCDEYAQEPAHVADKRTNTDSVLIDITSSGDAKTRGVVASFKHTTTPDVTNGIEIAVQKVIEKAGLQQRKGEILEVGEVVVWVEAIRETMEKEVEQEKDQIIVLFYVWVDDMLIGGPKNSKIDKFKMRVKAHFDITNLSEVNYVLSLQVIQDRANGLIYLSQETYIKSILECFGMTNARPVSTLLPVGITLSASQSPQTDKERHEYHEYAKGIHYLVLVGSLLYAMQTRPEIQYTVGLVFQFSGNPGIEHLYAAKHILRCSIGGFVFEVSGSSVAWLFKKQPTVVTSSVEAEYMAASNAKKEAIWLWTLLKEIDYPQVNTTIIHTDNQGCIALVHNPVNHSCAKHIDIHHHFIQERVELGEVELKYISTKDMLADVFTKQVPREAFEKLCARLGIVPMSH